MNIDISKIDNVEELTELYKKSKINDEIVKVGNVWEYKNKEFRRSLSKRAEELFSNEYTLAIYLHDKICKHNHTDGCGWYYEIEGLEHDWNGNEHKRYLEKSIEMFKVANIDIAKRIIDIIK